MIHTMKSIKKERNERDPQAFSLGSLLLSPPPFPLLLSQCFLTSSQADMFAGHVCPLVLVFYGPAGSFDTDFPAQGPAWLGASSSLQFLCQPRRPPLRSPPSPLTFCKESHQQMTATMCSVSPVLA
ncbi:hypothetical protein HJG60_007802 [Phyllostomus discolor]|uniref:Uncharacterized protein n=1 Tax=Phyllostomus discolor TaxID=89673 RepID=A0A834BKK0_9CHIR|nr:hypothetical protein HJG60_007802 [Phyllostomus discolor]